MEGFSNGSHAKVQADYRVSIPRPGSWVLDIALINSLPLAQMLIQVPIDIMLAYVIDRLVPANKARSIALEIKRERTAQSREETRRLEIMAQSSAIALNASSRALDTAQVSQERLIQAFEAKNELQAARDRSLSLRAHNDELNAKISDHMETQLISRTRGQVAEMGKPLLRSAEDLVISGANARGNIAYINRRILAELGGNIKDDVPTNIEGNIVGYQQETEWGQVSSPLNRQVYDQNGKVKYIILDNILENR